MLYEALRAHLATFLARCDEAGFAALNTCEALKAAFACAAGCFASMGDEQPCEVDAGAAADKLPGACLYDMDLNAGTVGARARCGASYGVTRRLCPCV